MDVIGRLLQWIVVIGFWATVLVSLRIAWRHRRREGMDAIFPFRKLFILINPIIWIELALLASFLAAGSDLNGLVRMPAAVSVPLAVVTILWIILIPLRSVRSRNPRYVRRQVREGRVWAHWSYPEGIIAQSRRDIENSRSANQRLWLILLLPPTVIAFVAVLLISRRVELALGVAGCIGSMLVILEGVALATYVSGLLEARKEASVTDVYFLPEGVFWQLRTGKGVFRPVRGNYAFLLRHVHIDHSRQMLLFEFSASNPSSGELSSGWGVPIPAANEHEAQALVSRYEQMIKHGDLV